MIKKLIVVILLFASMLSLIVIQQASSQSYTTITNLSTVTTQATFTGASQYAISTASTTSAFTESIYDGTITINGVGRMYCEIAPPISFSALANQQIMGKITGKIPGALTFILMSNDQYQAWQLSGYCEAERDILAANKVTAYNLNWVVPADGTYWLVIESWGATSNTVTINVNKFFSKPVTSTIFSTQTSILVVTATKTLNVASTQALSQPSTPTSNPLGIPGFPAIAIAIGLTLGLAVITLRRKRRK